MLGRPSPARQRGTQRRKSLDAVKREMRAEVVAQVRAPGKVNDRVKQWQKASKGAGVGEEAEEIVVVYETDSDVDAVVQEKIVQPKRPAPAKRKPKTQGEDEQTPERGREGSAEAEKERPRSKSVAPKKRVISDDHWMTKKKKSPKGKGNAIPKNFLQATTVNPPVEKKIEDWVRRTESVEPEPEPVLEKPRSRSRRIDREASPRQESENPRSRKVSRQEPSDDGIRVTPSRSNSRDDGIRIKPSKDRPRRKSVV